VSHPSLGLAPRDLTRGFPDAATRIRANTSRLAARALEIHAARDATLLKRKDEVALRELLRDAEVFIERLALSMAGDDPYWLGGFSEHTAVIYRRNRVRMDDAIGLLEGIRAASRAVIAGDAVRAADAALDAGVHAFREHRKLAGDARPRNRIIQFLYKGA
jgi:hypothetical protein